MKIAQMSLKNAAIRIEKSKIKRLKLDALEQEDIIDQEVKKVINYEMEMSIFADPSAVSKGVISPD